MRESVFLLDKDFNSLINNNSNAQVGGGFLLGKKNNKFLVQNSKGVVSESPEKI